MSEGGPFPPYPADVAQLEAIGDRVTRHGSRAASVGRSAAQRGRVAGTVDSFGLFDDIVASVQPATIAGTSLQRAGKVAALALSAWAGAVRGYDRQIRALNAEWQAAKANDFGVGGLELDRSSMKPAEITRAVSDRADDVADARADLWADLVRRRHRAKRELDAAADGVAALLNAGPDALDTALAGVSVSGDVSVDLPDLFGSSPTDGEEGPSTPIVGGVRMSNLDDLDEGYGPVDWVETLAFLFADPRECVGDDASIGGCGFEVAALFPWFKPLKAAKIAKYANRADEAGDASNDARRAADKSGDIGGSVDARQIANGHAFGKHAEEFRQLGITTPEQLARHITDVMNNPSDHLPLRRGRTAYWDDQTGTVVIRNPNDPDGGTAFVPRDGKTYFDRLRLGR